MTYEEYEEAVLKSLDSGISEDYKQKLVSRGCVKASYESESALMAMFNRGDVNVSTASGFAFTCENIYPDFPITWEEYEKSRKKRKQI